MNNAIVPSLPPGSADEPRTLGELRFVFVVSGIQLSTMTVVTLESLLAQTGNGCARSFSIPVHCQEPSSL